MLIDDKRWTVWMRQAKRWLIDARRKRRTEVRGGSPA
jgi:hypothetical protein